MSVGAGTRVTATMAERLGLCIGAARDRGARCAPRVAPRAADEARDIRTARCRPVGRHRGHVAEYRPDAFLLTNEASEPDQAGLGCVGPGSPRPDWLDVSGVEWTDTRQAVRIEDALPDAPFVLAMRLNQQF
jgi:hypothetical protein